jgi:hypothetical protein
MTIRHELFKRLEMTAPEREQCERGQCAGEWHIWTPQNPDKCQCGGLTKYEFGGLTLVREVLEGR